MAPSSPPEEGTAAQVVARFSLSVGAWFPYRAAWAVLRFALVRVPNLKALSVAYLVMIVVFVIGVVFAFSGGAVAKLYFGATAVIAGNFLWVQPVALYVLYVRRQKSIWLPGIYETAFGKLGWAMRAKRGATRISYADIRDLQLNHRFVFIFRRSTSGFLAVPEELFPLKQVRRVSRIVASAANTDG